MESYKQSVKYTLSLSLWKFHFTLSWPTAIGTPSLHNHLIFLTEDSHSSSALCSYGLLPGLLVPLRILRGKDVHCGMVTWHTDERSILVEVNADGKMRTSLFMPSLTRKKVTCRSDLSVYSTCQKYLLRKEAVNTSAMPGIRFSFSATLQLYSLPEK